MPVLWTMKDGKQIFLTQMSNGHLMNATRCVERHAMDQVIHCERAMLAYQPPVGSIAESIHADHLDEMFGDDYEAPEMLPSYHSDMIKELKRRGLLKSWQFTVLQ